MSSIYVLGSMNMDVVSHVGRHPAPGETVKGLGTEFISGGKGANQAVAAALSGGKVAMAGAVGSDVFGKQLIASLHGFGIKTEAVVKKEGTTGLAFITVSTSGENNIILDEGANGRLTPLDVEPVLQAIQKGDFVLLQNEISWDTTLYVIQECSKRGAAIFLNPAPAIPVSADVLRLVHLLIVNESEAEVITGVPVTDRFSAGKAIKQLASDGAAEVIVTLGEKGLLYGGREAAEPNFIPAFSVNPVDTTAAGDTFIGAYAAALSAGMPVPEALRFASAAAAISVTRKGAQSSIPRRDEVLRFLEQTAQ